MSRFDYVKYDETSQKQQAGFKTKFEAIEKSIADHMPRRSKALALNALEECYMWIGKMIRDDQIERSVPVEAQEERKDG